MDVTSDEFIQKVRSRGYKLTPQRKIVLEVLMQNRDSPLTPGEVYKQVKALHPGVGLTTVYRTLELLKEMGLLNQVHFHDGCDHYEINDGQPHH